MAANFRIMVLMLSCVAISVGLFQIIFSPYVQTFMSLSPDDKILLQVPPFLYFVHHDYIVRTYELYHQRLTDTVKTLLHFDFGLLLNRTKEFNEDIFGQSSTVFLKMFVAALLYFAIKKASNWGKSDKELNNLCDASDVHLNAIHSILNDLDEKASLKALRTCRKEKLEDALTASTSTVSWADRAPSKASDDSKSINEEFPPLNNMIWGEND